APTRSPIDGARCRPSGRTGAPQEAVRGFAPPTKDGDRPLKPRRSLSERSTASAPNPTSLQPPRRDMMRAAKERSIASSQCLATGDDLFGHRCAMRQAQTRREVEAAFKARSVDTYADFLLPF